MEVVILLFILSFTSTLPIEEADDCRGYDSEHKTCMRDFGRLVKNLTIEELQKIENSGKRYALDDGSRKFYDVAAKIEDSLTAGEFKSLSIAEADEVAGGVVTGPEMMAAFKKILKQSEFEKGDITAKDVYKSLGLNWPY